MKVHRMACMLVVLVGSGLRLNSQDLACSYTYQGQLMTPGNILELAPKAPTELEQQVQSFLSSRPTLIELFSGVAHYQKLPFYDKAPYAFDFGKPLDIPMRGYLESMAMALERAGMPLAQDQSRYNRVLGNFTVFMGSEWVIKSSGFLNRRANILHEVGMNNRDPELPQAQLDQFIKDFGPKTYQTISRMPYWLMIQEAIEKLKLKRIKLPKMYLVHIPGRPVEVNDSNYVIVEENIGGQISGTQRYVHETEVFMNDPEVKHEFEMVKQYADLWDNSAANYHVNKGMLYPIDTEQPNNQRPSNFFWRDRAHVM